MKSSKVFYQLLVVTDPDAKTNYVPKTSKEIEKKFKIQYAKSEVIDGLKACSYSHGCHDCENCPYNLSGIIDEGKEHMCLSLLHDQALDLILHLWDERNESEAKL